jgi:hypothetical protein
VLTASAPRRSTGFVYRLQEGIDRTVVGVIESSEKLEKFMKMSWKAVALNMGTTRFLIEFGVPWEGMQPLVRYPPPACMQE